MANETAAEKAAREQAEATQKAVDEALAAQKAEHDAELQKARDEAKAEALAELPTAELQGAGVAGSSSEPTEDYELLADHLSVPNKDGGVDYVKGDPVPLTRRRALELIAAGAIVDPEAEETEVGDGGQTRAPRTGARRLTADGDGRPVLGD